MLFVELVRNVTVESAPQQKNGYAELIMLKQDVIWYLMMNVMIIQADTTMELGHVAKAFYVLVGSLSTIVMMRNGQIHVLQVQAVQLDIKIKGLNDEIINKTLEDAQKARLFILNKMKEATTQVLVILLESLERAGNQNALCPATVGAVSISIFRF